ncbi:MAG: T9SS type A sorting domain-containing protein [Prevotellaceae bacterium]|nr:T9SS type A sorting domain-containing protein [Prevotellaceae bacterium]
MKVFSVAGAEILSQPVNGSLETNLNNGMYIVRFVDEFGKTASVKITIK